MKMKLGHVLLVCSILAPSAATVALAATPSPYAAAPKSEIKALSPNELDDLRNGHGGGMAKAAELNGYPGPAHVLELKSELGLDAGQIERVSAIRTRMEALARQLGAEILDRERRLDHAFAAGNIEAHDLAAQVQAIGEFRARLRATHLAAHLETKVVLSADQVRHYAMLRGYASETEMGAMHKHGHSQGAPEAN